MKVALICGYPAAGKSTVSNQFVDQGFVRLNRDERGGKVADLVPEMKRILAGKQNVVLDNTFPTVESRKPFIEAAKAAKAEIECVWLKSTIEDAQFNAALRMLQMKGKLLDPADFKREKSPNLFPVAVLFGYRKQFQEPSLAEGFDKVSGHPFKRTIDPSWTNKAIIIDYDGTVRETKSGRKYPLSPDDIRVLPGRGEILKDYQKRGFKILGASNQSGISKGELTPEMAARCFEFTNNGLGLDIEYQYCPHNPAPISCYCRKPTVGLGVYFMWKYRLDPSQCVFVGDMTTDKTFASRCGFKFTLASDFFNDCSCSG